MLDVDGSCKGRLTVQVSWLGLSVSGHLALLHTRQTSATAHIPKICFGRPFLLYSRTLCQLNKAVKGSSCNTTSGGSSSSTRNIYTDSVVPSVLWCCWLGDRKSVQPVKNLSDEVLAWLSVWSEVQMTCVWSSWCHCHPVISALENPEWLSFWCRPTRVVLEKGH